MKTIKHQFKDWNQYYIGYGYGTGEPHTLKALKEFFLSVEPDGMYDYQVLERNLTPVVAWLMINILCNADIIEYGTSPRHGWLAVRGRELKEFVDKHTVAQLCEITCNHQEHAELYIYCCPEYCNCDPHDLEFKGPCINGNVFWSKS